MDDSHRQQQAALAGKPMPEPTEEPEGDDMGDSFKIAGDTTTINHNYPKPAPPPPKPDPPVVVQPAPPPQPAVPEPEPEPEWKKWAKRAALAAAGAGLAGGYQWWNKPPPDDKPPAVTQPADGEGSAYWKYGVRVRPPGE